MKRILFSVVALIVTLSANAQTDDKDKLEDGKWHLKGVTGINASQTSLNNWSAGGENSFAGNAYLNTSLLKKSGNWLWSNYLILDYGLTNTKTAGTQKASDRIDFSTQLGYSTNNKWFYTLMGDFKTQFAEGYQYPNKTNYISKFFAPAYSNISVGLEYRPNDSYSVYLSPVAGKFTFVEDFYLSRLGAFGVEPGKKLKSEVGTYLKARGKKTLMTNVQAISSLGLFTAYDNSFGDVDVNWDFLLDMKINKYLSANLSTSLIYDDDVKTMKDGVKRGAKVQFKEVLGVGIAYHF